MNSYAWNSSLFTAFLPSARVMFTAPAPPTPTGTSASLFASSSYVVSTLEKKAFWSHLKRQQVRAFPYQSPWTNLLGGHSENVFHQPGTHHNIDLLKTAPSSTAPICIATIMLTDMQLTKQDIWPGRTALLKTGMLPPLELQNKTKVIAHSRSSLLAHACYNNSFAY